MGFLGWDLGLSLRPNPSPKSQFFLGPSVCLKEFAFTTIDHFEENSIKLEPTLTDSVKLRSVKILLVVKCQMVISLPGRTNDAFQLRSIGKDQNGRT